MNCPACQSENVEEATVCSRCGRTLRAAVAAAPAAPSRRSGSRRRNANGGEGAAIETDNPKAWRAYRISLWALVPGVGLLLGPLAVWLGFLALRGVGNDPSAKNRSRAAILLGVLIALTQWLGIALILYGL